MIRAGTILYALLAAGWWLDAFRMRGRARALPVLGPSADDVAPTHRFIGREGVQLDDATRRAASAFARTQGLLALDLVPHDIPAGRALFFLQAVDPARFRGSRLAKAVSGGEAMLVDQSVLDRMRIGADPVPDELALVKLAQRVKQYASTKMDYAVAPGLRAAPEKHPQTRAVVRFVFGNFATPIVLVQSLLALAGPWLSHVAGGLALAAMHLQILVATLGTSLRPKGLLGYALLRTLRDAFGVLDPRGSSEGVDYRTAAAEHRGEYARLLEGGTDRFFEPRREDCPLCGATTLKKKLVVGDQLQHKPGRFTLERCVTCRHIFQNPRLSLEGLSFYYRDFYDGLGEDDLEGVFRMALRAYRDRASMLKGVLEPARWLDVGTGHAHFCNAAREIWPDTEFHGADFGESVEEAERRGWIAKSFRGLFPDIARQHPGEYDVVSMSHYLEHTREPQAEIAAARIALRPGGALFIEVPDPESRMGTLLGRFWLPWFQPQHQHLLRVRNLEMLLRKGGFEPVRWHRGEAHAPSDLSLGTALFLHQIAPPLDRPWRKPSGFVGRLWNRFVWVCAIPMLAVARLVDVVIAPLLRRPGGSNAYRVVARKT